MASRRPLRNYPSAALLLALGSLLPVQPALSGSPVKDVAAKPDTASQIRSTDSAQPKDPSQGGVQGSVRDTVQGSDGTPLTAPDAASISDTPAKSAVQDPTARITANRRVQRIAQELEELRHKRFKEEVKVEVQSTADFRKYVDQELDKELPPAEAAKQSKVLQAFGLLPKDYDLRKGLADLFVSQAGAYYNPATRTFYILMAGIPDDQLDSIILHELAHALQDQYFDLAALKARVMKNPSDDVRSALNFVIEGEATYVMAKYQTKKAGLDVDVLPVDRQEMVFGMMRDMDRSVMATAAKLAGPKGPEGEAIRAAMAALKDVPGYLFWGLHDPYIKGQYTVFRTFAEKGWEGVDGLLQLPPSSTEQALHPEKLDPREPPIGVPLPDLLSNLEPGWSLLYTNTMGEAGTAAFFDQFAKHKKGRLSAGWGGDSFAYYEGPKGQSLLGWWTVWDTDGDADEFAQALEQLKEGQLNGGEGHVQRVIKHGNRVTLLAGSRTAVEHAQATGTD